MHLPGPKHVLLGIPIFVSDENVRRAEGILDALSCSVLTADFLDNASKDEPNFSRIVLVALNGATANGLETVRTLRRVTRDILCYCDGSCRWTLGKRCEVLLAGARVLLDSSDVNFLQKL